jgi:hypothetical protein
MAKGYKEAMDEIRSMSHGYLYEWCHEAYKDFYGTRGYHMWSYTHAELVKWWEDHFMWDNDEQYWRNQVPYYEEEYNNEQADWYDTSKELM